jgi:hypothetical protein
VRAALAASCLVAVLACRPAATSFSWQLEPPHPHVGAPTIVRVTIEDDRGPVVGAAVTVEAHMSHPGMTPLVVPAAPRGNGVYEAQLQLTMAGEWTFVGVARLANGRRETHEIKVQEVRPATSSH